MSYWRVVFEDDSFLLRHYDRGHEQEDIATEDAEELQELCSLLNGYEARGKWWHFHMLQPRIVNLTRNDTTYRICGCTEAPNG